MKAKTLKNKRAKLLPLEPFHYRDLLPLSKQVDLYKYGASDISTPKKLKKYMNEAFEKKEQGLSLPFIIYDKKLERFAGSTRFGNIDKKNKVVQIGWTWLGDDFRGSGLNHHIKFLMLSYAFEKLYFERVEFRIDERNMRSRRAVEKIGGVLEGVLRKDTLTRDGFRRSSACYGILREEWDEIKATIFKDLST
ncbi:GNAT family N-acetyltransferase [Dokdonia ponticola]|uniref:GNAT family N-acetyltransferase n=1 Tax=Dokdonia ponticola TaxID=2041041 RepID=A0ABV9HVV8_9FLAO